MPNRLLLSALVGLLLCAAPAAVRAAPPASQPPGELSVLLVFGAGYGYDSGYDSGFGLGGRYRLSVAPQGILNENRGQVRDSIDLEFGGDLVNYRYHYGAPPPDDFGYSWWAIRPRAGLLWNFWLTPQLALYPKLDLGYEFGWFDGWNGAAGSHPSYAGLFLEPSVGLIWRFRPSTSLRVELGSEGLKLGLGFAM